jgi:fructose-1-phosphate kinase PfkB-like protein
MIITVAPFPSVEYIYGVDYLEPNCEIQSNDVSLNILSKCIHSAQMIKVLQDEPILIGMLGGFAGKYIKHCLDKSRIKSDVIWTDVETPHQMKIQINDSESYYLLKSNQTYDFNKEINKLNQKLKSHIKKVSTLLLAGYIPNGINPAIYKEWIREGKLHNVKTIVCTGQKEVLEHAMTETPYALMFTKDQLSQLGIAAHSREQMITSLMSYLKKGVHYIGVYLKDEGGFMLSKNKLCFIEPPHNIKLQNNTASSGAFLGTFAIGINRKYEQEKFSKMCLAAALIADYNTDKPICSKKEMDLLSKKIKIKEIELSSF